MIEKVNPSHPDKVADRIAGALVDLAYTKNARPKIAVEVLIGHGTCHIIAETSVLLSTADVIEAVSRITGLNADEDCFEGPDIQLAVDFRQVPQDAHLAANQEKEARCGDNGIFKGVPLNDEEKELGAVIRRLYDFYPTDGKFIYDKASGTFIACQSNATTAEIRGFISDDPIDCGTIIVNPLGDWTGGTDVDTGATNRKLGSDMGRAVTGGGLHGKDLSKADVAINIACHLMAQTEGLVIEASCAIGDDAVRFYREDGEKAMMPYDEVVSMAAEYIAKLGSFEKLAEWGLF